ALWALVHQQLTSDAMPPRERPRPAAPEQQRVLSWLEQQATHARRAGGAELRRLNRRELARSLQDVLGLDIDLASGLVEDGKVEGFDVGAEKLKDTSASVDVTLDVVHKAVSALRFRDLPPEKPRKLLAELHKATDPKKPVLPDGRAAGITISPHRPVLPGYGIVLAPQTRRDEGFWPNIVFRNLPATGLVRLRLQLASRTPEGASPPWLTIGRSPITGRVNLINPSSIEVTGTLAQPQEVELLYFIEDGPVQVRRNASGVDRSLEVRFRHHLELPYVVNVAGNWGKDLRVDPLNPIAPVPWIFVKEIEAEVLHQRTWPPPNWDADLGALTDDEASARKLLALLTERAYRRPVAEAEVNRLVAFHQKERAAGATFDEAMRSACEVALVGGGFRFLESTAGPGTDRVHYAIASRLSYLFWGAAPDRELLDLAAKKQLRDPAVLNAQVERLLADPRARRFVQSFASQWFQLHLPMRIWQKNFRDPDVYFNQYLIESLRQETPAYLHELIRANLPVRTLVVSDFAMMNDATAHFYGYPRLAGSHFRRVALRENDPRGGGVLGHAGILSLTTSSGDSWPVYRGAYVLRNLLDSPPPPAPLEVPELDPNKKENLGKSMRHLLRQHQENQLCATCHRTMDPLGFGLQNFDISGRWRDVEHERYKLGEANESSVTTWEGQGKTRPVDASGQLPRGEAFQNFAEMKTLMANHYADDLARAYLKRLMLYATGRKPDVADLVEMQAIMRTFKGKEYPLRDLLKAVVRSRAFLGSGN
ncbi:MAG: DUF1592 domain-containing protein, partial [Planctomycetia bacterium]|nr:DUF1592 domain-containing protein [Planctomycetia bacterium]